jgi:quinol monooxygenase YgiN
MYSLFGKIKTQPGQRDTLLAYLLQASDSMADLEGCYLYVINSATDDPDGIWVYEVWRSREDHQASLTLDAVKAVITSARPLIAEMSNRVELVPLGGKGLPKTS